MLLMDQVPQVVGPPGTAGSPVNLPIPKLLVEVDGVMVRTFLALLNRELATCNPKTEVCLALSKTAAGDINWESADHGSVCYMEY